MDIGHPANFLFALDGIVLSDIPTCVLDSLPRIESEYCRAFRRESDQVMAFCSRLLRRALISAATITEKQELVFGNTPTGKPFIDSDCSPFSDLEFNISHSNGLLDVLLVPEGACGVDIEVHDDRMVPADLMTAAHFSDKELGFMSQAQGEHDLKRRFYLVWTLKEALLKHRGDGLAGIGELDIFDVVNVLPQRHTFDVLGLDPELEFYVDLNERYSLACVYSKRLMPLNSRFYSPEQSLDFIKDLERRDKPNTITRMMLP